MDSAFTNPERSPGGVKPQGFMKFRRTRVDSTICPATVSDRDPPASMLRGMEGYEFTQADLDFIRRMNQERLLKHLEAELADLEKTLRRQAMDLDLASALKVKAFEELQKMDRRTLLAAVEDRGVRLAICTKKEALEVLQEAVREEGAEEKERQEKCLLDKKHEIKTLKIRLNRLRSELAQETESVPEAQSAAGRVEEEAAGSAADRGAAAVDNGGSGQRGEQGGKAKTARVAKPKLPPDGLRRSKRIANRK